jgi:hypothetical protein
LSILPENKTEQSIEIIPDDKEDKSEDSIEMIDSDPDDGDDLIEGVLGLKKKKSIREQ